jgi:predicted MPP superfamily phosphohydrolase
MRLGIVLFFVGIFFMFFSTSEAIYINILAPLIKNNRNKIIVHLLITIIGQSFWFLLLERIYDFSKLYDKFFYFVFVCFLYTFLFLLLIKIFSHFKPINLQYGIIFAVIFSIALTILGHINEYYPVIVPYKINTDKNVKAKVAFITDLHIGDLGMKPSIMKKTMELIAAENVDFLVIGGDIIEGSPQNFNGEYQEIFKKNKIKTFAVLGNHDYYYKNYLQGAKLLEEANIDVLLDETIKINNLILIGREDITNNGRKTLKEIIKNVSANDFSLLIDHNPKFFPEAVKEKIDLQLSGHTHNGQFFPFTLIVKFFYEKAYGLLKKENSTLITSSGLSGWGPPIKLGSPVEIVVVKIN